MIFFNGWQNGKIEGYFVLYYGRGAFSLWPQAVDEYYFNPDTRTLGKSEGASLYGLPKDLGPFTLVYNKTLLDQQIKKYNLNSEEIYAKLSPTEPMTWSEFRALLKQIDPRRRSG